MLTPALGCLGKKMKKNVTLPNNYEELLKSGDVEALKKVFDKCELNAYQRGYFKCRALHFYSVPYDFMKWILEQGFDPNSMSTYDVPLNYCFNDLDKIKLLIEHGADINFKCSSNETPVHSMCDGNWNIENLKFILENGADINARNNSNETPLIYAIKRKDIPDTRFVQMVELLLEHHKKTLKASFMDKILKKEKHPIPDEDWKTIQKEITRIGHSHEFYKVNIKDENLLKEENANMKRLYEIFDVEPVPEREMVTETSLIKVKATEWEKQYSELWDLLVPGCGRAEFIQGEAIRLVGRLSYEVLDMGCCNWDDDFKKLPEAYLLLISYGKKLDDEEYEDIKSIMKNIKKSDDDDFNYIAEMTVKWILKNPVPVKLSDFKNADFISLEYSR